MPIGSTLITIIGIIFILISLIMFLMTFMLFIKWFRRLRLYYAPIKVEDYMCPKCGSKDLNAISIKTIQCKKCGTVFTLRTTTYKECWMIWPFLWWFPIIVLNEHDFSGLGNMSNMDSSLKLAINFDRLEEYLHFP